MDDESDIPKDHETNGIPCASEWNFSISDKVTSEMIRSLNVKQRKIFQVNIPINGPEVNWKVYLSYRKCKDWKTSSSNHN